LVLFMIFRIWNKIFPKRENGGRGILAQISRGFSSPDADLLRYRAGGCPNGPYSGAF
jgi:hypothetical protein